MAVPKRLSKNEVAELEQWSLDVLAGRELGSPEAAAVILKLIEEVRYFRALTDDYQQRTAPGTMWATGKRRRP